MSGFTVGITGPEGFIGRRLRTRLASALGVTVAPIPRSAWEEPATLDALVAGCDAIVHLAGVNRGTDEEVSQGNRRLAEELTRSLQRSGATPHVLFSSSTQRDNDSPYGRSKRAAEKCLQAWAASAGASLTVMVIPNVYGAGCRPFYNSVVATFCQQLTHGEQPTVLQDRAVEFISVSDLIDQVHDRLLLPPPAAPEAWRITGGTTLRISDLLAKLVSFRDDYFVRKVVPDLSAPLEASLYSTFLSYLELDDHRHLPEVHADERGELYEIIKLAAGGQVFFSTTRPGVIRGNHYHTRKVEWFCVLKGEAAIRLRPIHGDSVKEYRVSGDRPEFISIPVLHSHHLENVGDQDLLTMFWCNEIFDQADPDTFYEQVA